MKKRYPILVVILLVICCVSAVFINDMTKHKKESYYFDSSRETLDDYLPRISKRHIKELKIRGINLTAEDLAIIKRFRNLEKLQLRDCRTDDNALKAISELGNLKTLMISERSQSAKLITNAGLAHLEKLRDLQDLYLALSPEHVTDEGISHLGELRGLERLTLGCSGISDEGLRHLAGLHDLEILELGSLQVTGSGFHYLKDLKSLQGLKCSTTSVNDEGLKHIAQLRELRGLNLTDTETTDAGLAHLTSNHWLLAFHPSKKMTEESVRSFRETLLENRRQARERGELVPPDDALQISFRGFGKTLLPPDYFPKLQEFIESEQARRKTP